jgi:radical SAM superfamily enzyme YgiQ (UPF0313 family)
MRNYAAMCLQYCRGCPYDCEFCDIGLLNGRKPRTKSAAQVLDELDALHRSGWEDTVFFVDDNFIGKPKTLKRQLLPALIRWSEEKDHPFDFFTEASINLADDDELMELMVQAGFESVFVGIESPDENSLAECRKLPNKDRDLIAAVRKMQTAGLQVLGGFIVGFDSDPPLIFQRQVNFIQQSGIVMAMVGLLNAPRGTRLYQRLQKEGRLLGDTSGDGTFSMNFVPKMDYDRLIDGYRYIVTHIYSPRQFYRRIRTFLKNYHAPKLHGYAARPYHARAFFRALWSLGIRGKERFYYWRELCWTAVRHPHLVPLCIRLAIYGHHFRKVFESYPKTPVSPPSIGP